MPLVGSGALTRTLGRTYVRKMSRDTRLTDDRLASIEHSARTGNTLMDRVIVELVEEVRQLREVIAGGAENAVRTADLDIERSRHDHPANAHSASESKAPDSNGLRIRRSK